MSNAVDTSPSMQPVRLHHFACGITRFDFIGRSRPSYPTAVEFHAGVGESVYREHLAKANREHAGEPLSLYVHIPFCAKHCSYCGCHVISTPKREIAAQYLDYVGRELALVAAVSGGED